MSWKICYGRFAARGLPMTFWIACKRQLYCCRSTRNREPASAVRVGDSLTQSTMDSEPPRNTKDEKHDNKTHHGVYWRRYTKRRTESLSYHRQETNKNEPKRTKTNKNEHAATSSATISAKLNLAGERDIHRTGSEK